MIPPGKIVMCWVIFSVTFWKPNILTTCLDSLGSNSFYFQTPNYFSCLARCWHCHIWKRRCLVLHLCHTNSILFTALITVSLFVFRCFLSFWFTIMHKCIQVFYKTKKNVWKTSKFLHCPVFPLVYSRENQMKLQSLSCALFADNDNVTTGCLCKTFWVISGATECCRVPKSIQSLHH